MSFPAGAGPWFSHTEGQARLSYDDNIRMRAGGGEGATVGTVKGSIELGQRQENSRLSVELGGKGSHHAGASDLDAVHPFVAFLGSYDLERGQLVVRSGYRRDSVIDSEEHASGLVSRRVDRHTVQAEASWRHRLTERLEWGVAADVRGVDYRHGGLFGLHDYRQAALALDVEYEFSELTRLRASLRQDDFAPDAGGLPASATTVQLGVALDFYGDWTLAVGLGVRRTEVEAAPGVTGGVHLDPVPEVELVYAGRLNRFELGVERGVTPSGAGELLDVQHANLSWVHSLDPLWRLRLDVDAYHNASLTSGAVVRGRDYVRSTAALRYRVTPEWDLGGGYRFRYQKYDGSPLEARSHGVFLDVRYREREVR